MDLISAVLISQMLERQRKEWSDPQADPLDRPEWKELSEMLRPLLWLRRQWRRWRGSDSLSEVKDIFQTGSNSVQCRKL